MTVIKMQMIVVLGATLALLTGCDNKLGQEQVGNLISDINKDIVNEIGKKYPLPEQVLINSAHNDTVNYTTTLTVDKVVEFYRQAYAKQGVAEMPEAASVGSDSAKLAFRASADKSVYIQIEKKDDGTKVHLEKK